MTGQSRLPIPDDLAKAVRDLRASLSVLTADFLDTRRSADTAARQAADAAVASTRATGEVERLADLVTEVSSAVAELRRWTADQLEQLAADDEDEDEDLPRQPSWLTTANVDTARKLLADLAEWVKTVWCHYPGSALPACWAWHPHVVAELLAVRSAWTAAYRDKRPTSVAEWHDRWRPNAASRISNAVGSCAPAAHDRGEVWTRPGVPGGTGHLAAAAEWWATTRGSSPPTTPNR